MALVSPNPWGIRSYVPQAIRDYFSRETKIDNVVFGQAELDSKLLDLYREIKAATALDSENILIDNVLIHSDAYLYALRTIFRTARSHIRIFAEQLDQRMLDGTPLFTDPDIIDAVLNFLADGDAKFEILFRDKPPDNLFETHTLMSELKGKNNLYVYYSENRIVQSCQCSFVVADDLIYNLRYRNYAIINFKNPAYSRKLNEIFDRVRELDSTSPFSDRALNEHRPI